MNRGVRFWAAIVAVCGAASLLAQIAFGGVSWQTPWLRVVSQSFGSFLFSLCCSALCIVALPRLAPKILRGFAAPFSWAIITGLLAVLAAAGSLIAMLIFSMMGLVPPRAILRVWMGEPLKMSVISTLLFGMFFTVVGQLRARLDAAKLALRTKERDEAEARRLAAEAQLGVDRVARAAAFSFQHAEFDRRAGPRRSRGRRAHDDAAGVADALVTRQHVEAARPAGRRASRCRRLSGHRGRALRQPASVHHRRAGSRAGRPGAPSGGADDRREQREVRRVAPARRRVDRRARGRAERLHGDCRGGRRPRF